MLRARHLTELYFARLSPCQWVPKLWSQHWHKMDLLGTDIVGTEAEMADSY